MFEVEDAAACHGAGARPRSEQYGFEQRVMFGALLDGGALKSIDGGDVDVGENKLLRVASAQSVVWLEEEDRWCYRLDPAGRGNAAHVCSSVPRWA